jgi:hypothetical protein
LDSLLVSTSKAVLAYTAVPYTVTCFNPVVPPLWPHFTGDDQADRTDDDKCTAKRGRI